MPKSQPGRYTPAHESGKYTPPIPKGVRHSPKWFGVAVLAVMVAGVVGIVLNYINLLPGSPTPWYLVGGLGAIFVGFIMATRYH